MPRSNWKGVISFGLVNIPIALISSEDTSEKVMFHQIDKRNKARIKYERVNSKTGKEVPWENIIKGYVYDKDTIIPVEDDELKKVAGENARTIAIENFVKADNIELIDIYKTYYLMADKKGQKGYVILREALKKSGMMGIAKIIISTNEYVCAIGCYKNALVLYLLRYEQNILPVSELDLPANDALKKYKVTQKEVDTAMLLIKALSEKWNYKKYKDEYRDVVHKWATNKIKHKKGITMPQRSKGIEPKTDVEYIDLLRKSLAIPKTTPRKKSKVSVSHLKKRASNNKRAHLH